MSVNEFARRAIAYRRFCRQAQRDGFVAVAENGHPLGTLIRGGWWRRHIVDVRIAPGGKELWIKISDDDPFGGIVTTPRPIMPAGIVQIGGL